MFDPESLGSSVELLQNQQQFSLKQHMFSETRPGLLTADGKHSHVRGAWSVGQLLLLQHRFPQADLTALRCPVPDCRECFDGDVLRQLLGLSLRSEMSLDFDLLHVLVCFGLSMLQMM